LNIGKFSSSLSTCQFLLFLLLGFLVVLDGATAPLLAQSSTTTALNLSSASVAKGTAVTLTASVTSGGSPVNTGIVNFYELIGNSKLLLNSQPLTAGAHTAVLKYTFGVGAWTVEADFQATSSLSASSSPSRSVTVTGTNSTATAISSYGSAGNYTLTGTVKAYGTQLPTGDISFEDSSNGNSVLATQSLDSTTQSLIFVQNKSCTTQNCSVGSNPYSIQTADLNGDGILDIVVANKWRHASRVDPGSVWLAVLLKRMRCEGHLCPASQGQHGNAYDSEWNPDTHNYVHP